MTIQCSHKGPLSEVIPPARTTFLAFITFTLRFDRRLRAYDCRPSACFVNAGAETICHHHYVTFPARRLPLFPLFCVCRFYRHSRARVFWEEHGTGCADCRKLPARFRAVSRRLQQAKQAIKKYRDVFVCMQHLLRAPWFDYENPGSNPVLRC